LRELCIYDLVGDSVDQANNHTFFNYLWMMSQVCLLNQEMNDNCAEIVMNQL